MNLLLVFNHHSLPFQSAQDARTATSEFIKICLKAQNLGFSIILVDESIDQNWFRLKLADNFYWQDWYRLNNNDENKDLIRAFRNISTRQPLFCDSDIGEGLDLFEVKFNNIEYPAIKAAAWNEAPLASFPTKHPWNMSPLTVQIFTIDNSGELFESSANILNFYSFESIQNEESNLIYLRNALISTANDLYNNRKKLFPNIDFCGKANEQLLKWSYSLTIFDQVKESLTAINSFCEKWKNNEYTSYSDDNLRLSGLNHQVSGESETVHTNAELRRQREFYLPNGIKIMFEKHIKLSNGFRIHFFPDDSIKTISIAYIGKHLKLE